jgi:hypothetical protein
VELWQFTQAGTLTKTATTLTSDASGVLTVDLSSLASSTTDVAIKIGKY